MPTILLITDEDPEPLSFPITRITDRFIYFQDHDCIFSVARDHVANNVTHILHCHFEEVVRALTKTVLAA